MITRSKVLYGLALLLFFFSTVNHAQDDVPSLAGPTDSVMGNQQSKGQRGFGGNSKTNALALPNLAHAIPMTEEEKETIRLIIAEHQSTGYVLRRKIQIARGKLGEAQKRKQTDRIAELQQELDELQKQKPIPGAMLGKIGQSFGDERELTFYWYAWKNEGAKRYPAWLVAYDCMLNMELGSEREAEANAVFMRLMKDTQAYMKAHESELKALNDQMSVAKNKKDGQAHKQARKKRHEIIIAGPQPKDYFVDLSKIMTADERKAYTQTLRERLSWKKPKEKKPQDSDAQKAGMKELDI